MRSALCHLPYVICHLTSVIRHLPSEMPYALGPPIFGMPG